MKVEGLKRNAKRGVELSVDIEKWETGICFGVLICYNYNNNNNNNVGLFSFVTFSFSSNKIL